MSDGKGSVESLISAFFSAFNRNDAKSFAETFAEDAEFTNVFGRSVRGRKAIEELHAPLFSEPRQAGLPSFVNAELKLVDSHSRFLRSDVATMDIKWQQTGAIAPNGQPWGTRTGLMNLVLTREGEAWAIAVMHNMDLPEVPMSPG
jgi:uncharacterized protein (TIGR02246 family)